MSISMKPVKTDVQFPLLEESILDFWRKNGIVEKGLKKNEGKGSFVFFDGPPFATGMPHYGHILAGTLKDIVPRYWVMKGKYVRRRWGWDCHGLPVEFEMENELGLSGRPDIEKLGVAKFNESCRGIVLRYTKEWREIIERTGRWVDFDNAYRTMDTPFMETVWWVMKQLWDQGLVFEWYRVMPYSWRISTPLSNFEASLNYKEYQDPALTVKFKSDDGTRYFLAWTTTPWTLPSNLALSVNPKFTYVEIEDAVTKEHYVLSQERLASLYKDPNEYRLLKEFPGKTLDGLGYEPLFPHFKDKKNEGAFRIVLGDHVAEGEGTGIVHTAPAYGEDDFSVCEKNKIPLVDPVDADGKFTALVPEYQNLMVKDADKQVIKDLKSRGVILRHDTIMHNIPFCWRSDTPLIYKAITTWFVRLDPLKKKLVENNKATHWVPEHLRDGRFGNWLEAARDWNISRNRYWGTPLPIWRCQCGEMLCVGSISELEALSGQRPTDIHKHFIDDISIPCPKCKAAMKRIPEVLDCWFESGSMPYGQAHYPFENKESFEKNFPADFIAEGIDQTRGWFYTLSVLGTALFNRAPFKNVIVNGLVLAEDGKKMSKRLKNYPDPKYLLDTYGADALRAYLMSSPASHAEDLRFSEAGVKEIIRSVCLPFWNAYSFFVTYARADNWDPSTFDVSLLSKVETDLDRWILSRIHSLIKRVDDRMAIYHLYEVIPEVVSFIDDLTNWYIRLNRRRFWSEEMNQDKRLAYGTLYYVLIQFSKVLAPILPFITEEIFRNLSGADDSTSVHLTDYPTVREDWILPDLEAQMTLVETVVSMGRNLRNTHKIKTRQPLSRFLVITPDEKDRKTIEKYETLITHELNVKKVEFSSDESKWVVLTAKPNSKALGPRLGQKMKLVSQKIRELGPKEIATLGQDGYLVVEGERLSADDVIVDRQPKQEGLIQTASRATVWLDSKLDDSLIAEGRAREFVNRVQKLRKDMGLEVTDRINVQYGSSPEIAGALKTFETYISSETLAETLTPGTGGWTSEQDLDGFPLKLKVSKI
jgi:isoleucyl-tRNA synthetase